MSVKTIAWMTTAVALALASVLWAVPVQARTLSGFDGDTVAQAFRDAGASEVQLQSADGKTYVRAKDDKKLTVSAVLKLCSAGPCSGLELQYSWTLPPNKVATLASVNKFNREHIFATAVSVRQDRLVMLRYIIADGGIEYQNLVENLKIFMQMTQSLLQTIVLVDAPAA